MRLLKTFLIHLYTDTEAVDRVCGDIHPLDEEESYSFKNGKDFICLLQRLAGKPPQPDPLQTDSNTQEVSQQEKMS